MCIPVPSLPPGSSHYPTTLPHTSPFTWHTPRSTLSNTRKELYAGPWGFFASLGNVQTASRSDWNLNQLFSMLNKMRPSVFLYFFYSKNERDENMVPVRGRKCITVQNGINFIKEILKCPKRWPFSFDAFDQRNIFNARLKTIKQREIEDSLGAFLYLSSHIAY